MSGNLKFNADGTFKIMQVTDMHNTDQIYYASIDFLAKALDEYKPDLVVLTGDIVNGGWFLSTPLSVKYVIEESIKPIVQRNIPFVFCFGNHDQESCCPKTFQANCYRKHRNCLMPRRLSYLKGFGDYNLLIRDSSGKKDIFNIWMFDSGTRIGFSGSNMHPVSQKQIKRYRRIAQKLKEANQSQSVPSIVFQHVAVHEIYTLFQEVPEGTPNSVQGAGPFRTKYYIPDTSKCTGSLLTAPGNAEINSGQYSAWVEQGDVLAAFFGHDHLNDIAGKTEDNILLASTRCNTFQSRGDGAKRGVRMIELNEADLSRIHTYSVYYGDVMQTNLFPERVPYDKRRRIKNIPRYLKSFLDF